MDVSFLVWFLSHMNSPVFSQIGTRSERIFTYVTLVWLLSCVSSFVNRQLDIVTELFVTYVTRIWLLTCVRLLGNCWLVNLTEWFFTYLTKVSQDTCDKSFRKNNQPTVPKSSHIGEEPYPCHIRHKGMASLPCESAYVLSDDRSERMIYHTRYASTVSWAHYSSDHIIWVCSFHAANSIVDVTVVTYIIYRSPK